jgi:hypothetical protein
MNKFGERSRPPTTGYERTRWVQPTSKRFARSHVLVCTSCEEVIHWPLDNKVYEACLDHKVLCQGLIPGTFRLSV